ncbi:unnamed protein product [Phytophthora fragariaefolia]|uniref:Unnamed protein product n=1 Tax=Phytophthora fragariaefolia TaxID=1490495 RepID=A0A9W6Y3P3_9STRA|nr:unnamed protein product [Phytophthora fragariaefolia]
MSSREAVVVEFREEERELEILSQQSTDSPQTDEEDASLEDSSQTITSPSPPMAREKLSTPATLIWCVGGIRYCDPDKCREDEQASKNIPQDVLVQRMKKGYFTDLVLMRTKKRSLVSVARIACHFLLCPGVVSMPQAQSPTAFASLEERIAHLNWRKICNERQIQGTIRLSKQLQERDEFIRAAKSGTKAQRERMQQVIKDEFTKPLPVTAQFYEELTALQREDEQKAQKVAEKHMTLLHNIQTKLDVREAQLTRKKEFERKKKELFAGG